MSERPVNHHFIPQHFLRPWAIKPDQNKIFRYRKIEQAGKYECKDVSIKRTASIDNLYDVVLPDGNFEIESSIVTPNLDNPGHKVLSNARSSSVSKFSSEDLKELAIYITCLEARHPESLDAMNIVPELQDMKDSEAAVKLGVEFKAGEIAAETLRYFREIESTGSLSLSAFIQNERTGMVCKPFSESLANIQPIEFNFQDDVLLTSDFPVSRFGEYHSDFQIFVAISPSKGIMYSNIGNENIYNELPTITLIELLNIYTLRKAKIAFYLDNSKLPIIENHLGWGRKHHHIESQKLYIENVINMNLRENA